MINIPKDWRDYILLDAGNGEKLEQWGKVKVIRPDPQAFWPRSYKWEKPDMHYHRSKSGGGTWEILGDKVPNTWKIAYEGLRFNIRPTGFKHMGLFPEQAVNWQWLQKKCKSADRQPKVLNLFAYTGGATLACLYAGADVTHIDAAKGMNNWARDNIALSGFADKKFRVMTDDVLKFVRREARRGNMYDGIIMDPPVFGRGPGGEMWKLEEGLFELVEACIQLLSNTPLFFLINAYTAGFSPTAYGNILSAAMGGRGGSVSVGEVGLGAESGILLPCGMYARWELNDT
ncbi:MAG: class I SAM-dependent methyltransferase [Defluviitaleaceae bacterium]|nr:class I SAM-dependent methyltransferase [Defluviitaleaceae bacterium]